MLARSAALGFGGALAATAVSEGAALGIFWGTVCGLAYVRLLHRSVARLLSGGNARTFAALGTVRLLGFGLAPLVLLALAPPWSIGFYLFAFTLPMVHQMIVFARAARRQPSHE